MDLKSIAFSEKCSGHIGTLIINGLVVPHDYTFDPLVKIWTSAKRRIFERSGLDVVGIFVHDDLQEIISCNFYLVYGDEVEDPEAHTVKFEKSFHRQMEVFENAIYEFIDRFDGLEAYTYTLKFFYEQARIDGFDPTDAIAVKAREEICKETLNDFLRAIRLRTKRDDQLSTDKRHGNVPKGAH